LHGILRIIAVQLWSRDDATNQIFRQLMSRLSVANVSILELDILTQGHAYGELVLHLLMICRGAQRLKMKLLRDVIILPIYLPDDMHFELIFSSHILDIRRLSSPNYTFYFKFL
jgi:hypothetical protein